MNVTARQNCRSCKEKLVSVLSLGDVPVMNMGNKVQAKVPLKLGYCTKCTLLQLMHTVNPEFLFREYYYKSGVSNTIRNDLENVVKEVRRRVDLELGDIVVDIGANDGTLLSYYPKVLERCGFEPAENLKSDDPEVHWCPDFFSAEKFKFEFGSKKAKAISAISMFYDLDDPNSFLADVKKILAPDGIFVIQQNYLHAMLRNNAFDNIVHEHLEYYSVWSLVKLVEKHGLKIVDIEFNDINGGSFRTYIRHAASAPNIEHHSVGGAIEREIEMGLRNIQTYKEFGEKIHVVSWKLHALLERLQKENKLVYLAGASTRGNTLINVSQVSKFIKFAVERNPAKHGQTYNGIPVVSEKFADEFPPDYYLILPWHFASEFFMREQPYLRKGGKLIFPLPKPAIVEVEEL